jgi:2-amino-4-hydroxy-6-hydroxymethyldihydropteridine diphosphokinase
MPFLNLYTRELSKNMVILKDRTFGAISKQVLVAVGANLPFQGIAPENSVTSALDMLEVRTGVPLRRSRLWRTPAYPPGAGPDFVNAAAAFDWAGPADALLDLLHEIENAHGRKRTARWEARVMDLDLIAVGADVLPDPETHARWASLDPEAAAREVPPDLVLPHPRLAERGFVLAPLNDVAPDWRHPVSGLTVAEMLRALPAEALEGVAPLSPPG